MTNRNVQAGHGLDPATRVLTADLRWVRLGEIRGGDALVGFDEHGPRRKYRSAHVERVSWLTLPCYDIEFADGTVMRAARNHLWLTDANKNLRWLRTDQIRPRGPGGRYGTKVLKAFDVWDEDNSRDAGYLAAAFDGEGWLSTGGAQRGIHRMGFAQRSNAMLHHTEVALTARGINYRRNLHNAKSGYGTDPVYNLAISSKDRLVTFLGSVRPHRLLETFSPDRLGCMVAIKRNPVIRITSAGEHEVAAASTSTATLLAEGMSLACLQADLANL